MMIGLVKNKKELYKQNGVTKDISDAVIQGYEKSYKQVAELSATLKGYNDIETCRNIFNYLIRNVKYVEDPIGYQFIKTPARLIKDGFGDCKSFSVFIASCLRCLGIKHAFRFVSFSKYSQEPTHVYVVAYIGNSELILDAVTKQFDYEVPYKHKQDYLIKSKVDFNRIAGIITVQ